MAATQVCNYTPGWTNWGPGPAYVTLNGRLHHYMKIARSTDSSLGISYFIYDQVASQAAVPNARNVDPCILDRIGTGLKEINRYCINLQFLGLNALQNAQSINIIFAMLNQREHFDVCLVINNWQSGGICRGVRWILSTQSTSIVEDGNFPSRVSNRFSKSICRGVRWMLSTQSTSLVEDRTFPKRVSNRFSYSQQTTYIVLLSNAVSSCPFADCLHLLHSDSSRIWYKKPTQNMKWWWTYWPHW